MCRARLSKRQDTPVLLFGPVDSGMIDSGVATTALFVTGVAFKYVGVTILVLQGQGGKAVGMSWLVTILGWSGPCPRRHLSVHVVIFVFGSMRI